VVSVIRPNVLTGPEDADGREALHVVPADAEGFFIAHCVIYRGGSFASLALSALTLQFNRQSCHVDASDEVLRL
jgi:hypothetical protein